LSSSNPANALTTPVVTWVGQPPGPAVAFCWSSLVALGADTTVLVSAEVAVESAPQVDRAGGGGDRDRAAGRHSWPQGSLHIGTAKNSDEGSARRQVPDEASAAAGGLPRMEIEDGE
jgi:hypothetical protein